MIRNTHRNPVNRALHLAGMPLYVLGIALMVGSFAGDNVELELGASLFLTSVVMFTTGHKIEGNLGSITPVLAYRLLSGNVRRYIVTKRIHIHAR